MSQRMRHIVEAQQFDKRLITQIFREEIGRAHV